MFTPFPVESLLLFLCLPLYNCSAREFQQHIRCMSKHQFMQRARLLASTIFSIESSKPDDNCWTLAKKKCLFEDATRLFPRDTDISLEESGSQISFLHVLVELHNQGEAVPFHVVPHPANPACARGELPAPATSKFARCVSTAAQS